MKLLRWLTVLVALVAILARAAEPLIHREWTVEGVKREGLLHVPTQAATAATPVVFVFHGHGGSMEQAARAQPVHELWPEAIVVYLQGLPTPGQLTDPAGRKNGWQGGPGDQGDRDLKFFDAVLTGLRVEYKVDAQRIYSTGHSNGGGFTYLLWATRREVFAAFGPSAAVAGRGYPPLAPAPVIHVAGEKDPLVKFAWQKAQVESLRRINQCAGPGQPAGESCALYPSKIGAPVMTLVHSGGHRYPPEATAVIVKFFKAHPRP
ncbi:MAG: esterase [Opitutae bacterium]|nr:esterase [Opitutae bacterium]